MKRWLVIFLVILWTTTATLATFEARRVLSANGRLEAVLQLVMWQLVCSSLMAYGLLLFKGSEVSLRGAWSDPAQLTMASLNALGAATTACAYLLDGVGRLTSPLLSLPLFLSLMFPNRNYHLDQVHGALLRVGPGGRVLAAHPRPYGGKASGSLARGGWLHCCPQKCVLLRVGGSCRSRVKFGLQYATHSFQRLHLGPP